MHNVLIVFYIWDSNFLMIQIAAGHGVQKLNKTAMSLGAARSHAICFKLSNWRATPPHACNKMSLRTPVPSFFFANGRGSEHSPSMHGFPYHQFYSSHLYKPTQHTSNLEAQQATCNGIHINSMVCKCCFQLLYNISPLLTFPQTNYSWHLDGRLQSLDWTSGLDWWTGLVD